MNALERYPHINVPTPGGNGPIRSTNDLGRAHSIGTRQGHVVSLGCSTLVVQCHAGRRYHGKLDDLNRDLAPGDPVEFTLMSDTRLTIATDIVLMQDAP
jgi:hypothetical protein